VAIERWASSFAFKPALLCYTYQLATGFFYQLMKVYRVRAAQISFTVLCFFVFIFDEWVVAIYRQWGGLLITNQRFSPNDINHP
jgi:hypothetical protein